MIIEKCHDNVFWILQTRHNNQIIREKGGKLITFGESKEEEKEKICNETYSQEAKGKKWQICPTYDGYNKLGKKWGKVGQPVNQTAGCVEVIISEELNMGIGMRCYESQIESK